MSDGITEPRGLRILRKRAAVGKNLPVGMDCFVKDDDHSGHLKDLEWIGNRVGAWHSSDDALCGRIILTIGFAPVLVQLCSPGLKRNIFGFEISRDIADVSTANQPQPRYVWFAVRGARRWCGKVGLVVRGTRNAGRW